MPADPLAVAARLLAEPTAPLLEDRPRDVVEAIAADAGLFVARDAAGNTVVRYDGDGADGPPLVLVAHLDHPGFTVARAEGTVLSLDFHGGLGAEHAAAGSPLHVFTVDGRDPVGVAEVVEAAADERGRLSGATARLLDGDAPEGGFAMWGFPGFDSDGERIVGRVCDDLLGAAAALSALVEVARQAPRAVAVWGLFTRAEEIGFLGALEAIRLGTVPADAAVVSLECSKALPDAPQGGGVIVRVGDRMSIFDPELTAALGRAAEQVAAGDGGFRWQRKLMDGGACEATAFCASGYRASGLALPLGAYHNADTAPDGSPCVGPEHVVVDDYRAEVRLLVETALHPEWLAAATEPPGWLAERSAAARAALGPGGEQAGGARAPVRETREV